MKHFLYLLLLLLTVGVNGVKADEITDWYYTSVYDKDALSTTLHLKDGQTFTTNNGHFSISFEGCSAEVRTKTQQVALKVRGGSGGKFIITARNAGKIKKIVMYGIETKRDMQANNGSIISTTTSEVVAGDGHDADKTTSRTWNSVWNAATGGVSSVTISAPSSYNAYLIAIGITYESTPSYPYTWDFKGASNDDWDVTLRQERASRNWNAANESNMYYKYVDEDLTSSETTVSDAGLDMLSGLKFNLTSSSFLAMDASPEWHHMYISAAKIVVPDVTTSQRIVVLGSTTTNGTVNDVQFGGGDKSPAYQVFTPSMNGDYQLDVLHGAWIHSITVINGDIATGTTTLDNNNATTGAPTKATYTFTTAGSLLGGMQVNSVPGIIATFGNTSSVWTVGTVNSGGYKNTGKYVAQVTDANANPHFGIPTEGTFVKFEPTVNGELTVDASYFERQTVVIVDENGVDYTSLTCEKDKAQFGEYTFSKPLLANHVYYLYCRGLIDSEGNEGARYPLQIHGFSFKPVFMLDNTVYFGDEPTFSASRNNTRTHFPQLSNGAKDGVSYALNTENNTVSLNTSTGAVSLSSSSTIGNNYVVATITQGDNTVKSYYKFNVNDDPKSEAYMHEEYVKNAEGSEVSEGVVSGFKITADGVIAPGSYITTMPGLSVIFGNGTDTWVATSSKDKSAYAKNGGTGAVAMAVDTDGNKENVSVDPTTGIPTAGTFYILIPQVAGFLKVNGSNFRGHYNKLLCVYTDQNGQQRVIPEYSKYLRDRSASGAVGTMGWSNDDVLLIPGYIYYLYNNGTTSDAEPNSMAYGLEVHGMEFTPAFITTVQDYAPVANATVRLSDLTHTYPFVDSYIAWNDNIQFSSSTPDVATITKQTVGSQTMWVTNPLKVGSTDIACTVTTDYYGSPLSVKAKYTLTVENGPVVTYRVTEGFTPEVLEVIDDVEGIRMTFGGWNYTNKYTRVDEDMEGTVDEYYAAKTDEAGALDGFVYLTDNKQDARSEDGRQLVVTSSDNAGEIYTSVSNFVSKSDSLDTASPFSVPCRGTYYKFEPELDGTLEVYVMQNGVINGEDNDEQSYTVTPKSQSRAAYFMDEQGLLLKPRDVSAGGKFYFPATELKESAIDYLYTQFKALYPEEIKFNRDDKESLDLDGNGEEDEVNKFVLWYMNNKEGHPQTPFSVHDGYGHLVMQKSMVKYTIDVKAGKTYFLFGLFTKLGFSGFTFRKSDTGTTTQEYDEKQSIVSITAKNNAEIKTFDRNIQKGAWNPIVLPYSMNEQQVKSIFGDDVDIVYYDGISSDNVIQFKRHFYKMIVAGQPCFVKPSKDVMSIATSAIPDYKYVTITEVAPKTFDEQQGYKFTASYSSNDLLVKPGDYYVGKSGLIYQMAQTATEARMNGFRAFWQKTAANAKALTVADFIESLFDVEGEGSDPTAIVVNDNQPTRTTGIYTIDGQRLSGTVESLPRGIYIVNGKKIVVK